MPESQYESVGMEADTISESEVTELVAPIIAWAESETTEMGGINRTTYAEQKLGPWTYYDRGAHGIVYVEDKGGLACKVLYNPSEAQEVRKRYEALKDKLPLATLKYADNGMVVTEFQYGEAVTDPAILENYRQIAEEAGVSLDRGKFNLVDNREGVPTLVDW